MTDTPEIVLEYHSPDAVVLDENVRRASKAPAWLVESVRAQGVLAPVIAHRDMLGNVVVTDGQLRVLAAREALCETIPVLVGPAPGSAEARVVEQLTLNEAREKMSTADVAEAVKQLSLFGMEPSSIARKIGRPATDVEALQRVAKSPAASRVAEQVPSLTIPQLVKLSELSAREVCTKEILAEVEAAIQEFPDRAGLYLGNLERKLEVEEFLSPLRKELQSNGLHVVNSFDSRSDEYVSNLVDTKGRKIDPDAHVDCPGHAVWVYRAWAPGGEGHAAVAKPVCLNFAAHGHKTAWSYAQDAQERVRAEREKARVAEMQESLKREADWKTSHEARVEWAQKLLLDGAVGSFEWSAGSVFAAWERWGEWGLESPSELLESVGIAPTRVTLAGLAGSHAQNAKRVLFAAALQYWLELTADYPQSSEGYEESAEFIERLAEWDYKPLPVEQALLDAAAEAETEGGEGE